MARILRRFHNYLRKKYLIFENYRVYVTEFIIKEFRYDNSNKHVKTKSNTTSIAQVTII